MVSKPPSILTIDVGTQSVRCALARPDGDIMGIAETPQEISSPQPGWAQQRPSSWWAMVVENTQKVLRDNEIAPASIAAICVCGQMHGPVGVDQHGQITTEWVQLWCDKRCQGQCDRLRREQDEEALSAMTGNPVNAAWSGLKVQWIREHQPDVYKATAWFLTPKDFIQFRLTGVPATDPSEASGSFLYNSVSQDYCPELAKLLGLDATKFPPVICSHKVVSGLCRAAAQQTGLLEGTPVVAGGGDFPVSMLGFGVAGEGLAADQTGSSSLLAVHSPKPLIDPRVQNLRHVVDGWIPFTILDCGGLSVRWWRSFVQAAAGRDLSYGELIEQARNIPAGSDGLIAYPYMLGERRADNVNARGAFYGIRLEHTPGHFARALMEGVAYALKSDMELMRDLGVNIDRVRLGGGGSRNPLWNRIKADVWQKPVEVSAEPQAGLRGAALLGAKGVGLIDDLVETARNSTVRDSIEPDAADQQAYQAGAQAFRRLYENLLGLRLSIRK